MGSVDREFTLGGQQAGDPAPRAVQAVRHLVELGHPVTAADGPRVPGPEPVGCFGQLRDGPGQGAGLDDRRRGGGHDGHGAQANDDSPEVRVRHSRGHTDYKHRRHRDRSDPYGNDRARPHRRHPKHQRQYDQG